MAEASEISRAVSTAATRDARCRRAMYGIGAWAGAMRLARRAPETHLLKGGYRADAWVARGVNGTREELSGLVIYLDAVEVASAA